MALRTIGRYQIENELGRGGMAVVYLAQDPTIKRRVAIKVLPRQFTFDPQFRTRFQREAEIIASLEHPFIVPVYDFGEYDEQPFLVMRFMPGGSLANRLKISPISPIEAIPILERVGSALDRAHFQGIIHRDLKPDNILFDQYNEAFLSDFGIARLAEGHHTLTGTQGIVGTPAYMSPEQAAGEAKLDGRSDLYALGVILFEMLTGQTPYQADTPLKLMFKHVTEPLPGILSKKPDLPSGCETFMTRALAKQPSGRFGTAGELVATFKTIAQEVLKQPDATASNKTSYTEKSGPTIAPIEAELPANSTTEPVVIGETQPQQQEFVEPIGLKRMSAKKWLWVAGACLLTAGVIFGTIFLGGSDNHSTLITPTSSEAIAIIVANSPTLTPTQPTLTPTSAPAMTPTASPPPAPISTRTPSFTSTPTNTSTPKALTLTFSQNINVRTGPGTDYPIIGQAQTGQTASIIGRNTDNSWLQIDYPAADDKVGWVLSELVQVNGDPTIVTVVEVSPPPTPTASPPTPTPTAIPLAPATGRIAFVSTRDGNQEIYVMNPDGSNVTRLTFNEGGDYAPAWSPDASRIAFVRTDENYRNAEIYIMNVDGSGQVNLTYSPGYDDGPVWSPDGQRIVFIQATQNTNGDSYLNSADASDICIINADGSGQANLTNNLADNYGPIWSPDGTQIAFHSNQNRSYLMMNVDGSNVVELEEQFYWQWKTHSPDGKYFLYPRNKEIAKFNADGSGRVFLAGNLDNAYEVDWSPDGNRIIFTSKHQGNGEIYTVNVDGSGLLNLTNNPAWDSWPDWSPQ